MDLIIVSVLVLVLIVTVVCGVFRLVLDSVSHKEPFEPKTGIRKRVNGQWVTEWVSK